MKDCSGRPLHIGDTVASTEQGYTFSLKIFEVIGFTAQKVKLQRSGMDCLKFPEQVCRIDYCRPEDLAEILKEK
jgi:hypothetical protein